LSPLESYYWLAAHLLPDLASAVAAAAVAVAAVAVAVAAVDCHLAVAHASALVDVLAPPMVDAPREWGTERSEIPFHHQQMVKRWRRRRRGERAW